jgi:quinol monooxygenase YgiN
MAHLTVVATLKAKPGCEDKLLAMLQELLAPTRAEIGCINYDLHRSDDEASTYLFHETWESRPLWEAHMQSPHLVAFGEANGAVTESWTLFTGQRLAQG